MRKRIAHAVAILIAISFLFAGSAVQAQEFAKVGTVGTQFLKIPIGARGVAMGNAFSALSNDQTAMFWNPAGLVNTEGTGVMLEQINWLADISYNAVGVSYNINSFWAVGAFGATLDSGEMEETTVMQPEGTGRMFNTSDMMAGVSVASRLTDKFSFGANVKYVRENLDEEIASTMAVDVGTMYDTRWNTVRLAMSIRNFGPEIQLDGGYNDFDNGTQLEQETEFLPYHFPMTFRLGVAMDPLLTSTQRLTVVGELEHPNDNLERVNLGTEYAFQEMFFLRGGYTFRHDTMGLSAGVGASWNMFAIDYAFTDFSILDSVHRFSIQFHF
ncbi:PorV/PorQ family protein [bacterium]|nr:PorV/PorQ family protein [bacterium]